MSRIPLGQMSYIPVPVRHVKCLTRLPKPGWHLLPPSYDKAQPGSLLYLPQGDPGNDGSSRRPARTARLLNER